MRGLYYMTQIMNKLVVILICIFYLSCNGQKYEFQDLVGYWRISRVVTINDSLDIPARSGYISRFEFHPDSTFIHVFLGRELRGEWMLKDLKLELNLPGEPEVDFDLYVYTQDSIYIEGNIEETPYKFYLFRDMRIGLE